VTRVEFTETAGENERYAAGAFDGCVGQRVPFRSSPGGRQIGWATVLAVEVAGDGRSAVWTADLESWAADALTTAQGRMVRQMSFAFQAEPVLPRDPLNGSNTNLGVQWNEAAFATGGPTYLERHGHLPDEPCARTCRGNPAKLGGGGS